MGQLGSIVGDVALRVPIAGRIRPGFKRLTNDAKANSKVVAVYEDGLNKGMSFDQIAKRIEEEAGFKKTALVPVNAPHFTIRRGDFVNPKMADMIIEKYGETREDHPNEKRVYSLPIILPTDQWLDSLPHTLTVFNASGRVYWAEYQQDGSRICNTWETQQPQDKNRRIFGGRSIVPRQENEGRCDPERCQQFQKNECKLSGAFRFYVHDVPGIAVVEIPTTSFYSLTGARDVLAMLKAAFGRIAGTHQGKPILWVTKRRESIARYRPELGRSVQEKQWLIRLESREFDIGSLIASRDDAPDFVPRLAVPPLPKAIASTSLQPSVETEAKTDVAEAASQGLADDLDEAMSKVGKAMSASGVDRATALDYCVSRFGKGWSQDISRVNELLDDIQQFIDDPEQLKAMLSGEELGI